MAKDSEHQKAVAEFILLAVEILGLRTVFPFRPYIKDKWTFWEVAFKNIAVSEYSSGSIPPLILAPRIPVSFIFCVPVSNVGPCPFPKSWLPLPLTTEFHMHISIFVMGVTRAY